MPAFWSDYYRDFSEKSFTTLQTLLSQDNTFAQIQEAFDTRMNALWEIKDVPKHINYMLSKVRGLRLFDGTSPALLNCVANLQPENVAFIFQKSQEMQQPCPQEKLDLAFKILVEDDFFQRILPKGYAEGLRPQGFKSSVAEWQIYLNNHYNKQIKIAEILIAQGANVSAYNVKDIARGFGYDHLVALIASAENTQNIPASKLNWPSYRSEQDLNSAYTILQALLKLPHNPNDVQIEFNFKAGELYNRKDFRPHLEYMQKNSQNIQVFSNPSALLNCAFYLNAENVVFLFRLADAAGQKCDQSVLDNALHIVVQDAQFHRSYYGDKEYYQSAEGIVIFNKHADDQLKVINLLIEHGADITKNNLLDIARSQKNQNLIAALTPGMQQPTNKKPRVEPDAPAPVAQNQACSSSSSSSFFKAVPVVENAGVYAIAIHKDYNDHLKAYLKDTLNGKATNDSRLSKELRAQLDVDHDDLCSETLMTFPNVPVILNERLYSLEELEALFVDGKDTAKDPSSGHQFTRGQIMSATRVQDKINTLITKATKTPEPK